MKTYPITNNEAQAIIEKYRADGLTETEALEKWEQYRYDRYKRYEPAYRHLKNEMLGVKP